MSNTAQRIQLILAGWDGKTPIAGTINTGPISRGIATIAAEIDKMRAERDENQRIIDQVWAERDQARGHLDGLTSQRNKLADEVAVARAEVERLRLPAEAWKLQRRYAKAFGDNLRGRVSDVDLACLETEYEKAAARAAGQRDDDMAASLPTWIDVTVLLPASGTKVLAWDGHNVLRAMYAKRFTEEVRPGGEEEATEYSEGLDGYFLVEGWYEHNEFDEVHWTIENPVTHWMPLPAPPEARS